jgi:flagellar FliL protein
MAEATTSDMPVAAPSGSKVVPVLLVLNSLLVAGGIGFFVWRSGHGHGDEHASGEKGSAKAHSGEKSGDGETPSDMGPTVRLSDFVVHLRNPEADRYAKVSFELELGSDEDKGVLTPYLPRVRDAVITYLSDRTSEELRGSEGLDRLKHDLSKVIDGIVPSRSVRSVYIADFVLQ